MPTLTNRVFKKIKRLAKLVAVYHNLPYCSYTLEHTGAKYRELYRVEEVETIKGNTVINKPVNKSFQLDMSQRGLKQHLIYLYTSGQMSERAIDILTEQNEAVKK